MVDLSPLSRPVAIIEILFLLTLAAGIGWSVARLILNNRIRALRSAIARQESRLDQYRRDKTSGAAAVPSPEPESRLTPEPVSNAPAPPIAVTPVPTPESPEIVMPVSAPVPTFPIAEPVPATSLTPPAFGSESTIFQRIAARAGEVDFDRIGIASAADADDLKDISGIGPFLERKLHSLGIYTFRQITRFEKEDMDQVSDIIEFFPGRIERDNWVEQAQFFDERKYGRRISSDAGSDGLSEPGL